MKFNILKKMLQEMELPKYPENMIGKTVIVNKGAKELTMYPDFDFVSGDKMKVLDFGFYKKEVEFKLKDKYDKELFLLHTDVDLK